MNQVEEYYFFNLEDENYNSINELKNLKINNNESIESVELPCHLNKLNFNWSLIKSELNKDIHCIDDLINSMQNYNSYLKDKNFDNLYLLCKEGLNEDECLDFFNNLLPNIIALALKLPNLITQPIPYLKQQKNMKLHFTQEQIGCLLANAFLCTYPTQLDNFKMPDINFNVLYTRATQRNHLKVEKLKCFLNYFRRLTNDRPSGMITFERRCVDEKNWPDWLNSDKKLGKLEVLKDTTIEEQDGLRIDFANKKIGGGVLRTGCVQEEIQFLINPELVAARLFSESMLPNEVLLIKGTEKFNQFTGYAETFKWKDDYQDVTECDEMKRRKCRIIAMDAVNYSRDVSQQYEEKFLKRDCNKAFCGFLNDNESTENLKIITGNWGCGAFRAEKPYKSIIQLIACAQANRDMVYVSFEDDGFKDDLIKFYNFLISKDYTVGQIYRYLSNYHDFKKENPKSNFFDYVYHLNNC